MATAPPPEHPTPRRWAQPYPIGDFLKVLARNLTQRPSRKNPCGVDFLARDTVVDPQVRPAMRVLFLGDLMPIGRRRLVIGAELATMLGDADHLVANFEGVIWPGPGPAPKVFAAQRHHDLRVAEAFVPHVPAERIVLSLANNHAADFGPAALAETVGRLRAGGFGLIGTVEQPGVRLGGRLHVAAATRWSNQPGAQLPWLGTGPDPLAASLLDAEAEANLLFAHWGVEHELYPRADMVASAHRLLDRWDVIVGHHPHVPCPVSVVDHGARPRLVAWSLGQASSFLRPPIYRRGLAVSAELGPRPDGTWGAGEVSWRFVGLRADDHEVHLETRPDCAWFPRR